MKRIGSIVLASMLASTAYAADGQPKVSGQILAKFSNRLTENSNDNKLKGFDVERARLNFDAAVNDSWKAYFAVEAKQGDNSSSYFIKKAYIQASNLFMENDYFRTGITSNMYKDYAYKLVSTRWIETIGGDNSTFVKGEHSGLRYGVKTGPFTAALEIHNGHQSNKDDGTADESLGTAIYVGYQAMEGLSLHAFYNGNSEGKETTKKKSTTTTVAVAYNHSMFDTLLEYTSFDGDTGATPKNGRLTVDYRVNDVYGAYLSVNSFKDDDNNSATADTYKSKVVVGPTFQLQKGIKTGVFYSTATPEDSSKDKENLITWNWEAKF